MTKEQYLRMCEQTNMEIDWEKCPPEWEDFPESISTGMSIFNALGNRIFGDVGYVGKDYINLEILYNFYRIKEKIEKEWILEIIMFLDLHHIEESQKQLKAQHDKLKKK